jgi:hypothetical protein
VTPQQKNKIVLDVPLESQFDDVALENGCEDNQVRLPIHFCLYRNRNTVIASKEP